MRTSIWTIFWAYIAADNIDGADRWIEKLFAAVEALGQTPGMGHRREDLTSCPVLFWPVGAYLVIYRAERRPIEIVAVTQGSRDIPAFLTAEFAVEDGMRPRACSTKGKMRRAHMPPAFFCCAYRR